MKKKIFHSGVALTLLTSSCGPAVNQNTTSGQSYSGSGTENVHSSAPITNTSSGGNTFITPPPTNNNYPTPPRQSTWPSSTGQSGTPSAYYQPSVQNVAVQVNFPKSQATGFQVASYLDDILTVILQDSMGNQKQMDVRRQDGIQNLVFSNIARGLVMLQAIVKSHDGQELTRSSQQATVDGSAGVQVNVAPITNAVQAKVAPLVSFTAGTSWTEVASMDSFMSFNAHNTASFLESAEAQLLRSSASTSTPPCPINSDFKCLSTNQPSNETKIKQGFQISGKQANSFYRIYVKLSEDYSKDPGNPQKELATAEIRERLRNLGLGVQVIFDLAKGPVDIEQVPQKKFEPSIDKCDWIKDDPTSKKVTCLTYSFCSQSSADFFMNVLPGTIPSYVMSMRDLTKSGLPAAETCKGVLKPQPVTVVNGTQPLPTIASISSDYDIAMVQEPKIEDDYAVLDGLWTGQPIGPGRAPDHGDYYHYHALPYVVEPQTSPKSFFVNGQNFGTQKGTISFNDSSIQFTIKSWSDKRIEIAANVLETFTYNPNLELKVQSATNGSGTFKMAAVGVFSRGWGYGQCTWYVAKKRLENGLIVTPGSAYSSSGSIDSSYIPQIFDTLIFGSNAHVAIITSSPTKESLSDGSEKYTFDLSEMNADWNETEKKSSTTFQVNRSKGTVLGSPKSLSGIAISKFYRNNTIR